MNPTPPAEWTERVPVLTDGVITLRAHRESDMARIVEQCNDAASLRFTTVPSPYGAQQAREFLAMVGQEWASTQPLAKRYWAIEALGADGRPRFAGTIDYRPEPGAAEVGFGLHPDMRGHGLMARALRLVVNEVFARGDIEWLHWRALDGNWASRRTAWRVGFQFDGTIRGATPPETEAAPGVGSPRCTGMSRGRHRRRGRRTHRGAVEACHRAPLTWAELVSETARPVAAAPIRAHPCQPGGAGWRAHQG